MGYSTEKGGVDIQIFLQIQTEPITHFENRLLSKMEKGEVVTAYRVFHNMLNLRYEYVECMTNSNGRKDRSLLCPVALNTAIPMCTRSSVFKNM